MIDPIVVASAVLLATATTASSPPEERLTLERALVRALKNNSELLALEEEVNTARAATADASRLFHENPQLSVAIGPRLKSGEKSTLDLEAAIEQPLEVFGQRGLRVDALSSSARALELRVEAKKNALIFEVRSSFAHALAAQMRLALAAELDAVAEATLRAAEERHRTGAASRLEVSSARVEVGRAARDRSEAERGLANAEAELASVLMLERLHGVEGELALAAARDLTASEPARAERAAAELEVEAAKLDEQSAARDAYPDLIAGAKYAREEGADIVLGTLAIELPLFERNQNERTKARGRARQAELRASATEAKVQRELELAERQYRAAKRAARAYAGDVLRAMEENFSLAAEAYRAGKFDFIQLTLVRRETLDARRGYIESLEALNLAEAELLRATGGHL